MSLAKHSLGQQELYCPRVSHSSLAIACQLRRFTCVQASKTNTIDLRTARGQIDDRTHTLFQDCPRAVTASAPRHELRRARMLRGSKAVGRIVNAREKRCCRRDERLRGPRAISEIGCSEFWRTFEGSTNDHKLQFLYSKGN